MSQRYKCIECGAIDQSENFMSGSLEGDYPVCKTCFDTGIVEDPEDIAEMNATLAERDRNGWPDCNHGARMLANERKNAQ